MGRLFLLSKKNNVVSYKTIIINNYYLNYTTSILLSYETYEEIIK